MASTPHAGRGLPPPTGPVSTDLGEGAPETRSWHQASLANHDPEMPFGGASPGAVPTGLPNFPRTSRLAAQTCPRILQRDGHRALPLLPGAQVV